MATNSAPAAEKSVRTENLKERDEGDDSKARVEFEKAPIKGFADLPPDHPMAMRNAMLDAIEAANVKLELGDEEGAAADTAAAIATAAGDKPTAPPISAFTDPVVVKDAPKPAAKVEPKAGVKSEAEKQIEAQTAPIVLDAADLDKYQVRTKIDGVEELVPATKALGTYQKGAAADVRLANATKLQNEAKAAVAEALKQASPKPGEATTTTVTPTQVRDAQAAKAKFKEASDALYAGEADKAAELFSDAVALTQTPVPEKRVESATSTADLVSQVTAGVKQQLSQDGALKQLFEDYPDIKSKKAFALITDEYANAFMANGDDPATAIHKAGEAVGEEYHLGKWAVKADPVKDAGRLLNTGGPTTRADKLSAKEELDNIQSGNARSTSTEAAPQTVAEELEEMRKKRPGHRDIP